MTQAALPLVLEEIADVAGVEAMWALVRAKGGTTIFLPRQLGRRHWLCEVVGFEAAQKICAHFRSNHQERVLIPMAVGTQRAKRWREALAMGLSINDAAAHVGVHARTVSRYRAREAEPDDEAGQTDLFQPKG